MLIIDKNIVQVTLSRAEFQEVCASSVDYPSTVLWSSGPSPLVKGVKNKKNCFCWILAASGAKLSWVWRKFVGRWRMPAAAVVLCPRLGKKNLPWDDDWGHKFSLFHDLCSCSKSWWWLSRL